jgi:hypothetical protein
VDTENILPTVHSGDAHRIRFLGVFTSTAVEYSFRQQYFRDDRWLSRFLVAAGMLRIALLLSADYYHFGVGPTFSLMLAGRLLFLLASAVVLVALRRAASSAAAERVFLGWAFLLIALTVAALSARPPSDTGLLLMSFGMILVTYCVAPLPLARQAMLALTYSAAALAVAWRADDMTLSTVAATYLMSHVFGAVMSWQLNHRRREAFLVSLREAELRDSLEAAVAEVRTLRGLLKICAWCKRIRDEAEIWQSVETYVQSRTHASFSHGMCPDCFHTQGAEFARWHS